MYTFKHIFFSAFAILLLNSCQKLLIKPDPTSESEKNFEIFWNDLNNGYPYFVEDGINWKDRHDQYRKQVTKATTTNELFDVMKRMLSGFSDGHLSVSYGDEYYTNEKEQPNLRELIRENSFGTLIAYSDDNRDLVNAYLGYNKQSPQYFFENINKKYLVNPQTVTANNGFVNSSETTVAIHGKIDPQYSPTKNIQYFNISTFNTDYTIDNLLQSVINANSNSDALILDLRMNGGGSLGLMWDVMSVFLPRNVSELNYAYYSEKVGPLPSNFGPENYFAIFGKENTKYTKPVVVLVNRLSASASEHATMAMREIKRYNPKIKIVGDYTYGATSFIVERTLPNGIQYTLVNSKTFDLNRKVVERTGVKPDEQVFLTIPFVQAIRDQQMERAIEIIQNNQF